MTKTQRAKQESYARINDTISNNAAIATNVIGLEEEVDDLEATILKIINASTTQITEPVGLTNSETKKLLMADTVVKYILRAKVKAKATRNILNDNKTVLVIITPDNLRNAE